VVRDTLINSAKCFVTKGVGTTSGIVFGVCFASGTRFALVVRDTLINSAKCFGAAFVLLKIYVAVLTGGHSTTRKISGGAT